MILPCIRFLALSLLTVLLMGCASDCNDEINLGATPEMEVDEPQPDVEQIRAVLMDQQDAWNRGDIEGFMEGYWKSPDLLFTSGGRIRRGWQATLDAYRRGYTKETMGQLTFSDLEIVKTADNEAVVVGRWHLGGLEKEPQGGFTLVFRAVDVGWRVIRDHTTSD